MMDDWGDEGGSHGKGKDAGTRGGGVGEVEYKTKAGTAWSHSYLNQKPWHPLSYPNQRRKWIAEQTHANRIRRQDEVAREFAQEQEFFRQTALFSKKEKEKVELMKAVSFMYVRPPGYNAESAKAAEIADDKKRSDQNNNDSDDRTCAATTSMPEPLPQENQIARDKKKSRPRDVFGRLLPTEEEFQVLKNAPRLETGVPVRVKPFAVEVRNVRCVRCGTHGHQSGDRECPLKDAIMPIDENRLKRDDPLTAIMAHAESCEPLKWELKQRPGMSPPHGGFTLDDPNQQIVADDIFDEYGGFLGGGDIPVLLSSFSAGTSKKHSKKRSKHKHRGSSQADMESKSRHGNWSPSTEFERGKEKRSARSKHKKKRHHSDSSASSSDSERYRYRRRKHHRHHRHSTSESD